MALVLSTWAGSGRIADNSVQAWSSSGDAYADQNAGCAGPANEHSHSYTYSPTQFDTHTFSYAGHSQPQSTFPDRYSTTGGNAYAVAACRDGNIASKAAC